MAWNDSNWWKTDFFEILETGSIDTSTDFKKPLDAIVDDTKNKGKWLLEQLHIIHSDGPEILIRRLKKIILIEILNRYVENKYISYEEIYNIVVVNLSNFSWFITSIDDIKSDLFFVSNIQLLIEKWDISAEEYNSFVRWIDEIYNNNQEQFSNDEYVKFRIEYDKKFWEWKSDFFKWLTIHIDWEYKKILGVEQK